VSPDEQGNVLGVPGFATGGVVQSTGLALVHEGEWIVPAPGSEAEIDPRDTGGGTVAAYNFPIEVEVIGSLGDDQRREIAEHVFAELDSALRAQGT
jgi:hypothetical protein